MLVTKQMNINVDILIYLLLKGTAFLGNTIHISKHMSSFSQSLSKNLITLHGPVYFLLNLFPIAQDLLLLDSFLSFQFLKK